MIYERVTASVSMQAAARDRVRCWSGCLLLALLLFFAYTEIAASPCQAADSYHVIVDGREVVFADQQPYSQAGRLMVPIRPPMEALGIEAFWEPEFQRATLEQGVRYAMFQVGETQYTVNDIFFIMDVAPEISGGRMAFPLRYAAEAFGATVEWDGAASTVYIASCPPENAAVLPDLQFSVDQADMQMQSSAEIKEILAGVRTDYDLPALSAAIVWLDGRMLIASEGVRKRGIETAVTDQDLWHLGSCTKAMTATMIAGLVDRGYLKWDSTLGEAFPALASSMPAGMPDITLTELLTHTSGLPANPDWESMVMESYEMGMSPRQCRMLCVQQAAERSLLNQPGSAYLYSNLGYITAAVVAEEAVGVSWESLMQTVLYRPLGMKEAGFGGPGTPGLIDQPWPHDVDGQPGMYNSVAGASGSIFWGPAGYTYCSLEDWSRFIIDQMHGLRGEPALLSPAAYQSLVTATAVNPDYARGWFVAQREWGGGTVYCHTGSNLLNSCVVWMAPEKGFAVMAVTNQGMTDEVNEGLDVVAGSLVNLAVGQE